MSLRRVGIAVALASVAGLGAARGQAPTGICAAGGLPSGREPRAPMTEAAAVVFERLARRVDVPFANPTPLGEVVAFFRKELYVPNSEPPVAVYLDPIALREVEKTADTPVTLALPGVTLARGLELALGQLDLRHDVMPDGLVWITPIDREDRPRGVEPVSGEAARTWSALFKKVSLPFLAETPLGDVLKYVKSVSQTSDRPDGLPIYLDPVGLQAAEKAESTPLQINLEGQPLEVGLRLGLKTLGLTFRVRPSGLVHILDIPTAEEEDLGRPRVVVEHGLGANALLDAVESLRRQPDQGKVPAAKGPSRAP